MAGQGRELGLGQVGYSRFAGRDSVRLRSNDGLSSKIAHVLGSLISTVI